MNSDPRTMPADAPTPDWMYPPVPCPHCGEHPTANRMDDHIRTAHADLPDCTARIDTATGALYTCAFRAGHKDGEHGEWHASAHGPTGRYVWADWATGATPHREEQRP